MLMRVQLSGSTELRLCELLPLTVKDEKDAKARDLKKQLIPKIFQCLNNLQLINALQQLEMYRFAQTSIMVHE